MRIDSHHHFWRYDPVEYDWIDDRMSALRRDFLPSDLQHEIAAGGIDGVVSLQARQSLEETAWLLEMAAQHDFIKGVVGWAPLASPDVTRHLGQFALNPYFKGVRHVLQSEPDDFYLLRDDFNAGIRALKPFGLTYDILIFERHLPQTIQFVDLHPQQVFVVDHLAKPCIADGALEPWNTHVRKLARRENVFCKISGAVTEADWLGWTEAQLEPYVRTILDSFGSRRVMFGSDWPVCLVATTYQRWVQVVERFAAQLSTDEQQRLFGGNAARAYNLK